MTFLGAPTVPRLVCQLTYPGGKRYEVDDKGQYNVPNGEWVSGRLNFYDDATGALTLHVEKYISFISYPRRVDLPHSKHRIVWQPKFVADGGGIAERLPEGEIEPSALLAALENPTDGGVRVCHALEFAGSREAARTVLHRCVDHLANEETQSEYWLVGDDEEGARAYFDASQGHDAALRFDCLDPAQRQGSALDTGLLRRHAAEILFLHRGEDAFTPDDWRFWRELAVPGGLALVSHEDGAAVEPAPAGPRFVPARTQRCCRAPLHHADEPDAAPLPGPRWVLGEPGSLAGAWASLLDDPEIHSTSCESLASGDHPAPEEWPQAADVQAIDVFCDWDPEDPTGERAVAQFVAFIQFAGSLQDRSSQQPVPRDRGHPQGGVRHRRSARERPLGGGAQHGRRDRRGGQASTSASWTLAPPKTWRRWRGSPGTTCASASLRCARAGCGCRAS